MTTITNIKDYRVNGVTCDIAASFKAFAEGTVTKNVTLRVHFDNVDLKDIFTKACSSTRISWQNGPGRSKFDTWKDRQVVNVDFASPAKKVKTREEYIEEYAGVFVKAGLGEDKALELATKAVDNPEVLPDK